MALLLSQLRDDRLLRNGQALAFKIMAGSQLVGLAFGLLVGQSGNNAEIVERLVGFRLALCLAVVGADRRGAGFLIHQVAIELAAQALVRRLRGFQLKLCVDRRLLHLRIAHFQ